MRRSCLLGGLGLVVFLVIIFVPKVIGLTIKKEIEKVISEQSEQIRIMSYDVSWFTSEIKFDVLHEIANGAKDVQTITVDLQHGRVFYKKGSLQLGLFGATLKFDGFVKGEGTLTQNFDNLIKFSLDATLTNNPVFWKKIAAPNLGPGTLELNGFSDTKKITLDYRYNPSLALIKKGLVEGQLMLTRDTSCSMNCLSAYKVNNNATFSADQIVLPSTLTGMIEKPIVTWRYDGPLITEPKKYSLNNIPEGTLLEYKLVSATLKLNGMVSTPIIVPNIEGLLYFKKSSKEKMAFKLSYQNAPVKVDKPISFSLDGIKLNVEYEGIDFNRMKRSIEDQNKKELTAVEKKEILQQLDVDKFILAFEVGKTFADVKEYRLLGLQKLLLKANYAKGTESVFDYQIEDFDFHYKSPEVSFNFKDFNLNLNFRGTLKNLDENNYLFWWKNQNINLAYQLNYDDVSITVNDRRDNSYFEFLSHKVKIDYDLDFHTDKESRVKWDLNLPKIIFDFQNHDKDIIQLFSIEQLKSQADFNLKPGELLFEGGSDFLLDSMAVDLTLPRGENEKLHAGFHLKNLGINNVSKREGNTGSLDKTVKTTIALLESDAFKAEDINLQLNFSGITDENVEQFVNHAYELIQEIDASEEAFTIQHNTPNSVTSLPDKSEQMKALALDYLNLLKTIQINFALTAKINEGDYAINGDLTGIKSNTEKLGDLAQALNAFTGDWYLQTPKLSLDAMVPPTVLQQYEQKGLLKLKENDYVWHLKFSKDGIYLNDQLIQQVFQGLVN